MTAKIDTKGWTLADKRYGWKFGCDGTVNSVEAASMIGKSQPWLSEILRSDERKKPDGKGYPLRAGQSKRGTEGIGWSVCVRSINEYLKAHEPVEV